MEASVKVMLSYDYCHFEIALSETDITLPGVDNLRKRAQRLADKAVEQYKIAKADVARKINHEVEYQNIHREVEIIKENYPKSEWNPEQKAKVKKMEDLAYLSNRQYDYEDNWEDEQL